MDFLKETSMDFSFQLTTNFEVEECGDVVRAQASIGSVFFHVVGVLQCPKKANAKDGLYEVADDASDHCKKWFKDMQKIDEGVWQTVSLESFGIHGRWFIVIHPHHAV